MVSLRQYAAETTIHGLPEYYRYESKGITFKIIWTTMLVAMTSSLIYHTHGDVKTYLDEPTATVSRFETDDTFPAVALCTNDYINPAKLPKYNVSLGADGTKWKGLSKLLGPQCPSVLRPSIFPDGWKDPEGWMKMITERLDDELPGNSISLKDLDYIEILRDIAYDFEELGSVYCGTCLQSKGHKVTKVVKEVGACWVVEPGKLMPPTNRMTRLPTLSLNLKFPTGGLIGQKSSFEIYLAEHARHATGWSSASVAYGKHSYVDVTLGYNRKVKFCNGTKGHSYGICDAKCANIQVTECGMGCGLFLGDIPGSRRKNFCGFRTDVDATSFACLSEAKSKCGHCLSPCNYTTVQATVLPAPMILNNTDMEISIVLRDIFNVLVYREYFSYTWKSLVSDLGGLLGLFLGASMVSIAHTVYFFAFACSGSSVQDGGSKRAEDQKD